MLLIKWRKIPFFVIPLKCGYINRIYVLSEFLTNFSSRFIINTIYTIYALLFKIAQTHYQSLHIEIHLVKALQFLISIIRMVVERWNEKIRYIEVLLVFSPFDKIYYSTLQHVTIRKQVTSL